jgi:hypothetical protein
MIVRTTWEEIRRKLTLRIFLDTFRRGWLCGYPFCCVLRYSLDRAFRIQREEGDVIDPAEVKDYCPAHERGVVYMNPGAGFVPCCHWRHPNWRPFGTRPPAGWIDDRDIDYIPARRPRLRPVEES